MRIYRLNVRTHDQGEMVSWHGKRADAVKARAVIVEDCGKNEVYDTSIVAHDVAVGKEALLKFLNFHTPNRDNG